MRLEESTRKTLQRWLSKWLVHWMRCGTVFTSLWNRRCSGILDGVERGARVARNVVSEALLTCIARAPPRTPSNILDSRTCSKILVMRNREWLWGSRMSAKRPVVRAASGDLYLWHNVKQHSGLDYLVF